MDSDRMNFQDAQRFIANCRISLFAGNKYLYPQKIKLLVHWHITEKIKVDEAVIIDDQNFSIWRHSFFWSCELKPGDTLNINLNGLVFQDYPLAVLLRETALNWAKVGF